MLILKKYCFTSKILNKSPYGEFLIKQQPVKKTRCTEKTESLLRFQSATTTTFKNFENSDTAAAKEWANAKPHEEIPTMTGLSALRKYLPGGEFTKLDATQLMHALQKELGNISRFKGVMGRPNAVITYNVDDFEKVLRNEGIWPNRPGAESLQYYRTVHRADFFQGTVGLLATQGEEWGNFRSVVNPILMQPKNARLYLHKMSKVNKEFIERIRKIRDPNTLEVPDNFVEELNRWTLESVSVVALDKQLGIITTNRDDPMVKELFKAISDFSLYAFKVEFKPPIWKYYKTPTFNKLMKTLDILVDITSAYVNEAIQRIDEDRKNGVPEKPDSEKSVLEKLITIDRKMAAVMAIDMLLAGVDTTSSTLAGILLCLAKNPEKQQKLREEIMKILPEKDSEFEEKSLKNLPYLRACIKEALRMYPLIVGNARVLANDVVLSGYQVPKGTQVSMISTSLMNNNDYYPRCTEYLPERWLRSGNDTENTTECPQSIKPSTPFLYLPFGFGPRSCVGRRIVEMELELGIARMIRNFHIEFNYPTENAFKSVLINVPNIPLKFKFTEVKN